MANYFVASRGRSRTSNGTTAVHAILVLKRLKRKPTSFACSAEMGFWKAPHRIERGHVVRAEVEGAVDPPAPEEHDVELSTFTQESSKYVLDEAGASVLNDFMPT